MSNPTCYFAIFGLPKPAPEHKRIVEVIRATSNGDFKQFVMPGGMGFVFTSELSPWNISFGTILMNTDTLFITEISKNHRQVGYGSAAGWLNSHFPRR